MVSIFKNRFNRKTFTKRLWGLKDMPCSDRFTAP